MRTMEGGVPGSEGLCGKKSPSLTEVLTALLLSIRIWDRQERASGDTLREPSHPLGRGRGTQLQAWGLMYLLACLLSEEGSTGGEAGGAWLGGLWRDRVLGLLGSWACGHK